MRIGIALFLLVVPAMALGSHGGYSNLARQYWSQKLEPDEDDENKSQILDDTVFAFLTYLALVVVILLLMAWLAARR